MLVSGTTRTGAGHSFLRVVVKDDGMNLWDVDWMFLREKALLGGLCVRPGPAVFPYALMYSYR